MTATPNFVSGARAGAVAAGTAAPAANAAPFVLNLCSSSTPMALAQTDLPELRRFTFFVSRRFEEGRERFRLHMGYFVTLAEAEEWLGVVREIYPGAWAGEAPGRKLRERAAAAAAAQAQHAAGPQPHAPPATVARAAVPPRAAPARTGAAPVQPGGMRVPVVHAAPPLAPAVRPPAAPPVVKPAARLPSPAAPPPRHAPAGGVSPPRPAPPRAAVPAAPRVPAPPAAATRPGVATAPRKAAGPPAAAAQAPRLQGGMPTAPARATPPPVARAGVKPVFEDSNVREVLKALGDASATGETRLMRAPPPPREATTDSSMSDTQVLKLLETRRSEGDETPPPAEVTEGGIPLLKPDDTGTRRALKEAVASNAPVAFAVQLQWSVQPVELDKVPPLAIFSAYTLYTVEGSRDGRKWYGLRLGFFSDAISAKQVAYYVRSEFTSVAVVPVSPQEKSRATDQDVAATLSAPVPARADPMEEFKLIDDLGTARTPSAPAPAAPAPLAPTAPGTASKAPAKALPRVAVGRALSRSSAPPPGARTRGGKVGAREHRGPQTLEETLEILGASQLSIDQGKGETLNDTGVRHLRVEVQQKNSPFSKLLERLSERLKKP